VEIKKENGRSGTVGGRGLLEVSGELRMRVSQSFGLVGFVDAGLVTENPALGGKTDVRTGVGVGLRYYTGIGALRADLAAPINRRDEDSIVALYIGIGQSF
jgi:translocation and assembly module TamA